MKVLGIDPGTATTGYGVVEGEGNRLHHTAHGVITTPAKTPFATRLHTLHTELAALIAEHRPDAVAIEKLYFTKNITTGISVAQERGVIALAAVQAGLPIGEFNPLEVKQAVVGYGKATKKQVQEMVKVLLNLDGIPRPDDAADGLAIAICQIHAGVVREVIGE